MITMARGPKKGAPQKAIGPRDIPRHKCEPEEESATIKPATAKQKARGLTGTKTTYYRCRICHVSMGSRTEDLHY